MKPRHRAVYAAGRGTLFVAAKLAKAGIGAITRHLAPLMAATVAVLLFVTYVPSLTLGVARFLVK